MRTTRAWVPVTIETGYGLSVHARVTPYLGVGAGYADVYRFGFDDASELKSDHDRHRASTFLFLPCLAADGGIWPTLGGDAELKWPRTSPWDLAFAEVGLVAGFDPAGDDVRYQSPPDTKSADSTEEHDDAP